MPHRAVLTHEDDLFGRVALFNNLVTLDQIVECARFISTEITAGRPRKPLATVLISKGYLSPQAAGAVEAAVRTRVAEQHGAPPPAAAAPTSKPPPLWSRAPAGTSQVMVAVRGAPATGQPPSTISDQLAEIARKPKEAQYSPEEEAARDERLRKVIAKISPGRIYPEMLNFILKHRISIIDVEQLAAAIGEPEKAVVVALHRWQSAGLLKTVGTHPYCFSPTQQEEQEIALFLSAWKDPARHAKTLGFILAVEE